MSELLFIRHAETDLAGTFCGHSDPPVNARGLGQIDALLASLAGTKLCVVHTSDLQRARFTAERIAAVLGCPLVVHRGLREIDFGQWEGLTWSQIERRDPTHAQHWVDRFPSLAAPDGELFADFKARVLRTVCELPADPDGCAAVVTHAGPMRVVSTEWCGKSDAEAWALTRLYCARFRYKLPEPER